MRQLAWLFIVDGFFALWAGLGWLFHSQREWGLYTTPLCRLGESAFVGFVGAVIVGAIFAGVCGLAFCVTSEDAPSAGSCSDDPDGELEDDDDE